MKKTATNIFFVFLGGSIWACGLNVFLFPNQIVSGGVSGLAAALGLFFPLPVGGLIILLNLPIFFFAVLKKGVKYSAVTFGVMTFTSFLVDISALFLPVFTEDRLFSALLGGVLCGGGLGLIYLRGFTTGGSDLLASLLSDHFPTLSYGRLILILDLAVVSVAALCYRDWRSALYSALSVYAAGRMIDRVLSGSSTGKAVYIISEQYESISAAILREMERGVTLFAGEGGFRRQKTPVLFTVIRNYELYKIKRIVSRVDRSAFVVISDASEIQGQGFSS